MSADGVHITWYLVYPSEDAPRDMPWGLYRRVREGGRVVQEQAYHPKTGWHRTDYWLKTKFLGEPDKYLLEVDEQQAMQAQGSFDRKYKHTDDPSAAPSEQIP